MKIAVDFDGTIVEEAYPYIGKPIPFAIDVLKRLIYEDQHQVILWTVREGKLLDEAVEYCRQQGVEFYAVNKLHPEIDDRNIGGLPDWGLIYRMISNRESWQSVMNTTGIEKKSKRKGFLRRVLS